MKVGIDLPELIRLKLLKRISDRIIPRGRDWSAWIDTIETHLTKSSKEPQSWSRRDWSAWIDTIETRLF